MVLVQYCSERNELGYGMARLFDSFVPRWLVNVQHLLCVAIYGFEQEGPKKKKKKKTAYIVHMCITSDES